MVAKNITNLFSILTIGRCPRVESSFVLLAEGVCYDQCVLVAKLLWALALLHSVLQGQICLLLQVCLDFLLLHSSPLLWKGHLFLGVGSRRSCRSTFQHYWPGHRLVMLNRLPWKETEIIVSFLRLSKYCILDSLVDCEGYSISSKGFLPTVVNTIHPFQSILVLWFLRCWCSLLPSPVWPLPIYLDSWP